MPVVSAKTRKFHLPDAQEDAAIASGIADDPDMHEVGDAEFATLKRMGRPRKDSPKVPVTLRLDADLLAALRDTGQGWQTRVNEALRAWLKP
jgi:uncharacterized protein (DUF4415 family)